MHVGNEMTERTMKRRPTSVGGLEPASTLIRIMTPKALVGACGIKRLQLWRWTAPKSKGGTGGRVPQSHHEAIITYAKEHGIALPLKLLVPGVDDETLVS